MNSVVIIGRLVKRPELAYTSETKKAVTTFSLAVDKFSNGQKEADFPTVVAWGKQAENLCQYQDKGRLIGVKGRIATRSYDAKDGTKKYVTEIVADEIQFLEYVQANNTNNPVPDVSLNDIPEANVVNM